MASRRCSGTGSVRPFLHVLAGLADGQRRGVRLRRRGDVRHGLRQRRAGTPAGRRTRVACSAAAATTSACGSALPTSSRRADHDAPGDEARVLAGFQHPRQPVDRRVRIAAAHALDEGAGHVVMRVAGRVVVERLALDRILGDFEREVAPACAAGSMDSTPISSAVSARRASPSQISARKSSASSVVIEPRIAQAALLVRQRPLQAAS